MNGAPEWWRDVRDGSVAFAFSDSRPAELLAANPQWHRLSDEDVVERFGDGLYLPLSVVFEGDPQEGRFCVDLIDRKVVA
jgi:hypothetical protein